jgi:putative ABC transport system ATP-binding protein
MDAILLETEKLCRDYPVGSTVVHALRGIDFRVAEGEMVAIMGASGSGKSTLMNVLGCLDRPSSGRYRLAGQAVETLGDDALAELRNRTLGFIFQGYNLLPRTTAVENVMLPLLYSRGGGNDFQKRAILALEKVGLGERLHHNPDELSGGQQQRVAIARALVTDPSLVLADEPTGNLDSFTTVEVMSLFQEVNEHGMTLVIVTHEEEVAEYCRRILTLRDGRIVSDRPAAHHSASEALSRMPSQEEA